MSYQNCRHPTIQLLTNCGSYGIFRCGTCERRDLQRPLNAELLKYFTNPDAPAPTSLSARCIHPLNRREVLFDRNGQNPYDRCNVCGTMYLGFK